MDLNLVIGGAALVLLTGVAAVRVSARAGLPSLLLYLVIGLAIGEAGLGLQFEDLELTMVLSTLALAVILAEGGFSTRWDVIRPVVGLAGMLATVGVAASVAVTALIAYVALDVDPRTALLLGAVVGSTDAAATFSIMRRLPVRPRLRATLEAESGFNDPPVIILVTVVASDAWYEAQGLEIAALVVFQLVVGLVTGLVVAWCGQWLLSRSALPAAGLYPLATFAILFLAFATAGVLGGSGLMAIYVAGMWLGNARLPHHQATAGFADGMGWLAQIGLFVLLGLLASPNRLADALLPALIVGVGLTFVARPLSVAAVLGLVAGALASSGVHLLGGPARRGPDRAGHHPDRPGAAGGGADLRRGLPPGPAFTLLQAPSLPWLARRTGVVVERAPRARGRVGAAGVDRREPAPVRGPAGLAARRRLRRRPSTAHRGRARAASGVRKGDRAGPAHLAEAGGPAAAGGAGAGAQPDRAAAAGDQPAGQARGLAGRGAPASGPGAAEGPPTGQRQEWAS